MIGLFLALTSQGTTVMNFTKEKKKTYVSLQLAPGFWSLEPRKLLLVT